MTPPSIGASVEKRGALATAAYKGMNLLCHALHLAIVLFLVFAWAFPALRAYHLALIALTLGSWAALGYCPLTEGQWWIRKKLGLPDSFGPYIPFLVRRLYRGAVDSNKVDRVVTAFSVVLAVLSLGLNIAGLSGRWGVLPRPPQ